MSARSQMAATRAGMRIAVTLLLVGAVLMGQDEMSLEGQPKAARVTGEVVDTSGIPVGGAIVRFFLRNSPSPQTHEVVSLGTDSQGSFDVVLVAGKYRVQVDAAGYARSFREYDSAVGTLRIQIEREGAILGHLSDAESQREVAGLPVRVLSVLYDRGRRALSSVGDPAMSDADGWFRIGGLRPGEYFLEIGPSESEIVSAAPAVARMRRERTYTRFRFPPGDQDTAPALQLYAGMELNAGDIRVSQAEPREIRGTLAGEGCPPGASYTVVVNQRSGGGSVLASTRRGQAEVACGAGFSVANVGPGAYSIEVSVKSGGSTGRMAAHEDILVLDRDIELQMSPAPPLLVTGTVEVSGEDRSRAASEGGLPGELSGVQVALVALAESSVPGEAPGVVDKQGRFRISHPHRGRTLVQVMNVPSAYYVERILYNGSEIRGRTFDVNPSFVSQSIRVIVSAGAAKLEVISEADSQNGISQDVQAYLLRWPLEWENDFPVFHTGIVSDTGTGSFERLAPGTYRLVCARARAGVIVPGADILSTQARNAQDIALAPGELKRIVVPGGCR